MEKKSKLVGPGRILAAAIVILALLVGVVGGCANAQSSDAPLKVGLLPIPESLPFYLAEAEGYFEEAGVRVELVPFTAAVERDAAIQTGQLDAILNDPISALLLSKENDDVRIVKTAYKAAPGSPMISLVATPRGTIKSAADLKNIEIAISKNSIIEYVTDRLAQSAGLKADEVKKTEISKIPVRLEMLMNDQVFAASMPEPFAFLSKQQGAKPVLDDGEAGIGFSTITIRQQTLESNRPAVERFLAAHQRAVEVINANPEQYRALLVDKAKLPAPIAESFPMPPFPGLVVPSEAEMDDVLGWMQDKELISRDVAYDKIVDGSYTN